MKVGDKVRKTKNGRVFEIVALYNAGQYATISSGSYKTNVAVKDLIPA